MRDEILYFIRKNKEDLDEAASAYKNIDKVMAQEADLVKILVKLTPLAVIKASSAKPYFKKRI
jgi:RNA-splicing ligase RtcB